MDIFIQVVKGLANPRTPAKIEALLDAEFWLCVIKWQITYLWLSRKMKGLSHHITVIIILVYYTPCGYLDVFLNV